MKFICNTEFVNSTEQRQYKAGGSYEIDTKTAEKLIALDEKKPLGALSFFTPADDEAVKFVKEKEDKQPEDNEAKTKK